MYPPREKPLLIWDGTCGFCKYWVLYIRARTGDRMDFESYQDAHPRIADIPFDEFQKASRLIEPDGKVYAGPDSLYASMRYFAKPSSFFHRWYGKSSLFRIVSDYGYHWISMNRPFLYQVTIRLFGKNPVQQRPYWFFWLLGLTGVVVLMTRLF